MKTKNKKILLIVLVILAIIIGFFREHIFVSINLRIQQIYYNSNENIDLIPSWVNILNHFTYSELIKLKWILTSLFIAIYWSLGLFLFKLFSIEKKLVSFYNYSILGLLLFSLVIFIVGDMLFNKQFMGYEIARFITGFLQSPLPALICFSLFKSQKIQSEKEILF